MKTTYVYPGTFSPPTFGHLSITRQAAKIFPEIIILCSENPDKKDIWFTPDECKELWETYKLPKNVKVMTQPEFRCLAIKMADIVIVRGLRSEGDLEQEKKVMILNKEKFGIKKYFYIFGPNKNRDISSSKARQAAANLDLRNLSRQVSRLTIDVILEKIMV
jgi:pantetheine-phosphate adenylyltransferase